MQKKVLKYLLYTRKACLQKALYYSFLFNHQGSVQVSDEGLMRACHVVRVLLASRYDIRNALYKLFVKVALIGTVDAVVNILYNKNSSFLVSNFI